MRNTLVRLVRLAAGYSLVTLLGPLFTVFLTPIYTRVLTPADYGVVDVTLTVANFCVMVAVLGMDQALSAFFFDQADPVHARNLVTTAVQCALVFGALLALAVVVSAEPLAQLLFKDPARAPLLHLLAVHVLAAPTVAVVTAALRLRMGVKRVNGLALTSLLVTVIANVLLVVVYQLKAVGVVAATAINSAVAAGLGLILAWGPLHGRFDAALARPILRTGAGLAVGVIGWGLLSNADRLLLTQFVSPTDLGLYSIANKLATMAYVLLSAGWAAWWPMALEMASKPEAAQQYARMFDFFVAAAMFVALGVGLLGPEILSLFTRAAYVPAAPLALVLLLHFGPLSFMGGYFQIGLYARKQTGWVTVTTLGAAALNIFLNLVLAPVLGVWGAVLATVLASAAWAAGLYAAGQRVWPIAFHWRRIAILWAVYLTLVVAFLATPALSWLPAKAGALLAFVMTILAAGVVSTAELRAGWQAVRGRLARLHLPGGAA